MKRLSYAVAAIALIVIAVITVYWYTNPYRYSDETQIRNLLIDEQMAIRDKNVKGALANISRTYKDSTGNDYNLLRITAFDVLRSNSTLDALLEQQFITVKDNTARANIRVTVTRTSSEGSIEMLLSGPLTVEMEKFNTKRWYIFPAKKWLVTRVDGLPNLTEE